MEHQMELYERFRTPPQEALKTIAAGRLKGYTDINPMWRIKALTGVFGPCGIGWKYTIDRQWTEAGANGELAAFVNISLYIKQGGTWSDAIPGTGGSSFVAKERNGLYTSDECYKMALTDAISVACKALGMAADVYWQNDRTKYSTGQPAGEAEEQGWCERCGQNYGPVVRKNGEIWSVAEIKEYSKKRFEHEYCPNCQRAVLKEEKEKEVNAHG